MSSHGIELVKQIMSTPPCWEDPSQAWFRLGDDSEVALVMQRTIEAATGAAAIWDLGSFWLWHHARCAWVPVDPSAMGGAFRAWSGLDVFSTWADGREGEQAKCRRLRVDRASGYTDALRDWCSSRGVGVGFFEGAQRGISFRDRFLAVLPRAGGGLRVAAQPVASTQRCRASYPWAILEQDASCPRWIAHLESLWTPEEVEMFGEFLGAAILGVAPHLGRALYLVGAKGSGKSTLLEVVRALMPDGAVSYVPPSDWGDKHKPGLMLGSRLNIVYEADDQGALMAQAQIRQIISGEPMTVDRKYAQPFMFRPQCAHIFATNGRPLVPGAHAAFWDRFLILTLDRTVRGTSAEVRDYHCILLEEREAIIAWALDLVIPALAQGRYTIPASVSDAVEEWRIEADSVATYVDEMCEPIDGWTDTMDLYRDYARWCEGIGQRAVALRTMAIRLRECTQVRKEATSRRSQVQLRRRLY